MIKLSNDIKKAIAKNEYYSEDQFIQDAKTYIKAVNSGRILYQVMSVSRSGMSRNIKIISYEGTMAKGYYRQYSAMLECLGYNIKNYNEVHVTGCGMDMLFYTNYSIIHSLKTMGFISSKKCDTLAQLVN